MREYPSVMGYVTQEKYLHGKTSRELESLLGLRPGEMRLGAYLFSMARLPHLGEYAQRFSLAFPAGRVFGPDGLDAALQPRRDFRDGRNLHVRSHSDAAQYYPPGSGMIPQWEITQPVPLSTLVAVVTETMPFRRESGSTKSYAPHNRGPVR